MISIHQISPNFLINDINIGSNPSYIILTFQNKQQTDREKKTKT